MYAKNTFYKKKENISCLSPRFRNNQYKATHTQNITKKSKRAPSMPLHGCVPRCHKFEYIINIMVYAS